MPGDRGTKLTRLVHFGHGLLRLQRRQVELKGG